MKRCKEKTAFRFYIKSTDHPQKIIGIIGLNNVVWGAFCSAFLGYKLDVGFVNKGYMSMAVGMLTKYAFEELGLHRIEANVMPKMCIRDRCKREKRNARYFGPLGQQCVRGPAAGASQIRLRRAAADGV